MLAPVPASSRVAREHIAQLLEDGPLADLVDVALLLVSEVVTNAVLHAGTDIELTCTVAQGSLCVEVSDRSTVMPSPRHFEAGATTGRGLGLLEALADQWGVDVDAGGKTVWFVVGARGEQAPRICPVAPPGDRPHVDVELVNLPADLVIATIEYGDAVLREHALLTIGTGPGSSGEGWLTPGIDLGPVLGEAEAAQATGRATIDVVLAFPEGVGAAALERLALVDEADRLAQDGELLTPAAVPEVGACRRWLYSQIGLQADGAAPVPWAMPEPADPAVGPAQLPEGERRRLDALTSGAIVADDANRILYVNAAAGTVLGWEPGELAGRRLVTIVPPEQRAAHLAAFSRYLVTGEARILGRPVRLPALRHDGSTVEVDITIEVLELGAGRLGFRALLG